MQLAQTHQVIYRKIIMSWIKITTIMITITIKSENMINSLLFYIQG